MKAIAILRILISLPLLGIGFLHLTGVEPMAPILEGAKLPLPELTATLAPIAEVVGGLLLFANFRPRIGALFALGTMAGALAAHLRFDWADEPPILLPIAVFVGALVILARGGGCLRGCAIPKNDP